MVNENLELQNENDVEITDNYQIEEDSQDQTISDDASVVLADIQAEKIEQEYNKSIFVKTKFGPKTQPVSFTIIATGQSGNTSISGGKLRLIYGRIYFLPIDTAPDISSDNFANLKMFSDMADKIDVRFINNQFAAIIPLQNNIMLSDDTRLCVLW